MVFHSCVVNTLAYWGTSADRRASSSMMQHEARRIWKHFDQEGFQSSSSIWVCFKILEIVEVAFVLEPEL